MNWFVTGDETSEQFVGNATAPDHFRILDKDDFSIIVGGRLETLLTQTYLIQSFKLFCIDAEFSTNKLVQGYIESLPLLSKSEVTMLKPICRVTK